MVKMGGIIKSTGRNSGMYATITKTSCTWCIARNLALLRIGARMYPVPRPNLVVRQLPHEDVPVHGPSSVIESSQDIERAPQLGALPRDDHEGLGRFVIANLDPGQATTTAYDGTTALGSTSLFTYADSIAISNIYHEGTSNPTPAGCQ